ncbi:MAG: ABC transporter permease [Bacteroidota bacterium]
MLNNYLKIALRTLLRFKGFAIINLFGLSLGLTAGVLIMIFVADELSFDKFHVNRGRIYRVLTQFYTPENGAGDTGSEGNAWPVGDVLRRDFPEVESVVYMRNASFLLINHDDKRLRQSIQFASPEFLTMFTFPLVKGNPSTALNDPYSIVISEDMEKKFFNGQDALNKTMTLNDTLHFVVSGVMKNIPSNSHIQLDMVASFATFESMFPDFSYEDGWGNINMRNYVMLKEGADPKLFAAKAFNIYNDRAADMLKDWGVKSNVIFEPLTETYLQARSSNSIGPLGSLDRLYLVSGIAVFVIILACINFVNLATARSVYRAKEVGLRKVSGSSKAGLMRQFLTESFVLTILSFAIAMFLTWLSLPLFNELMQKNYTLGSFFSVKIIAGLVLLLLLIGTLAGLYPAVVMSSMNAVEVLKGRMQSSGKGVQLRRTLVIFQFAISSILATGTLIVLDQLDYMQKQKLGFDKDNIIVVNLARAKPAHEDSRAVFKQQVEDLAIVDKITFNNALPGVPGWDGQVAYPEGRSGKDAVSVEYMAVDAEYVPTMGLEVLYGRNFDIRRTTDMDNGLVLNETAANLMGWSPESAIGKKIESPSGYPAGEVIGVVKDYHNAGLQQKINPLVMDFNPNSSYMYAIRYKAADTKQLIGTLQDLWKEHFPGYDFNYFFLDDKFNEQYKSEEKLARVFAMFATLTVVIAAIGLLGLVSFMVVARTKEIGVRKVLGAGVFNIVRLLSKEFIILVTIANVVAIPVAWYFANEWLSGFAFRMQISPLLFVWTLAVAVGLTLITVGYQTIRAALVNPVNSLRYE